MGIARLVLRFFSGLKIFKLEKSSHIILLSSSIYRVCEYRQYSYLKKYWAKLWQQKENCLRIYIFKTCIRVYYMMQGIIRNQIKDLNTPTFDAIYMYIYLEVVALKIDDDMVWYKLVTNWCVKLKLVRLRRGKTFLGRNKSNGTSRTMAIICLRLHPRSSIKSSILTCSLISHLLFSTWGS